MQNDELIPTSVQGRFARFFHDVFATGQLVLARDSDWFSLKFRGGEALPVWSGLEAAKDALSAPDWGDLELVEYPVVDFFSGFTSPPYDGLYVSIMPDKEGNGRIVTYSEFLAYLREGIDAQA